MKITWRQVRGVRGMGYHFKTQIPYGFKELHKHFEDGHCHAANKPFFG
jgi:hypothetical protein